MGLGPGAYSFKSPSSWVRTAACSVAGTWVARSYVIWGRRLVGRGWRGGGQRLLDPTYLALEGCRGKHLGLGFSLGLENGDSRGPGAGLANGNGSVQG